MICDRCGSELPADAATCPNCSMEQGEGWACSACGVRVPDTFEVCWSCQTPRGGGEPVVEAPKADLVCLRCRAAMKFLRLLDAYLAYGCPRCGRVELFEPGIGADRRPPST